jgi:GDP-mannose 6-dehydrogenase
MKRVAVFGLGYVGCVTAACLARDGHTVIGVDTAAEKVAELNSGLPTILEPGLEELVSAAVRAKRLTATTSAADAITGSELALIAVGTPSREDGGVAIEAVRRVVCVIADCLRKQPKPFGICVRSTMLPGILEESLLPQVTGIVGNSCQQRVWLCNNPEFLREGTAIDDYDHPPYVVVGANARSHADEILDLYQGVQASAVVTDTKTAALVKYVCNAFHALKVSFANEVGALCRSFGADGHQVMRIVCEDRKLNISSAYMRPGLPFGGSCLPKDLRALVRYANEVGVRIDLLPSILMSNDVHLSRAIGLVLNKGHRRIGVVGLGFKKGTEDLRESPSVLLCEALLGKGRKLKIYDPHIALSRMRGQNLAYVDRHLPHLAELLTDDVQDLYDHAELLVLTNNVADEVIGHEGFGRQVIDLRVDLAAASAGIQLQPL